MTTPRLPVRLNDTLEFTEKTVWAKPEQLWAVSLGCAFTHNIHTATTAPRFLLTSKDGQSGKTTLGIHIPRLLAFNFFNATLASEPSIRSAFLLGERTIGYDEISKLFGEAGTGAKTSPKYAILCTGYEWTATFAHSENRVPVEIPIYGVAFMTGLKKAAPDDLRTRCIIIEMKEAPSHILATLQDVLDPDVMAEGIAIGRTLHQWVRANSEQIRHHVKNTVPQLHPRLVGRRRQIWGGMGGIALAAGGDWPDMFREAFISLALDEGERVELLPKERLLLDAAKFFELHGNEDGTIYSRDLRHYVQVELDRDEFRDMSIKSFGTLCTQAFGKTDQLTGTWHYPLEDGTQEVRPTNHRGWRMPENLLKAKELQELIDPAPQPEARSEYEEMFD